MKNKIELIYEKLYEKYGPQGWWPIKELEQNSEIKNSYHKNNFDFPKTKLQEWEIIIGALLTQNTSFKQVTKAINNLYSKNILSPNKIILTDIGTIKQAIKPAGYFNQKSKRLTELAKWFLELKQIPKRCELLELNGIGPETADSILLYAFKTPSFVIDTYTKRILLNLKLITPKQKYNEIKELFETNLKKDYKLYQEYHALLVEHAKKFYIKKENYSKDFLLEYI